MPLRSGSRATQQWGSALRSAQAKTFLSSTREPKVDFFEFLFSGFAQMFRQVVPVRRVKTLTHLQYKVGNVKVIRQGIQKRTRPQFRLTCVAEKRLCLNSFMFSTGKVLPEVQPLTLFKNSYDRKETSFVYIPLKNGTALTNLLNKNNRCIYFSHLQQQNIVFRIRRFSPCLGPRDPKRFGRAA